MEQNKYILETIDLEIGFTSKKEKKAIASGLHLNLTEGKLVTLIGENGIGKSTLLRTLTGIQPPLKGKVLLYEKDLKKLFPETIWNKLHLQIIFFGRSHCPARGHNPYACPICSKYGRKELFKEYDKKNKGA